MNKEKKSHLKNIFIFSILAIVMGYLIFYANKIKDDDIIESVQVAGSGLLSEMDYLNFTRLNPNSDFSVINFAIIKDRFEKHPYVKKTDIKYTEKNKLVVAIEEKRIYGIVLSAEKTFLISESFEMLPFITNTKIMDVPVLSNLSEGSIQNPLSKVKTNDMIQAFKIIDALHLTDETMFKKLVEINLRRGGDVILTFSGINTPIIFGRGNEAAKVVSLETLLRNYNDRKNFSAKSEYIDLRFSNHIYVGNI